LLVVAVSSCNQILHFSELSLEVQGGQDYFRFVEGTCIIVLCLSSLSLFLSATFRFWLSHQKLNSICFWLVTSVGENEEKENTIKPPFVCFSHLQLEVWVSVLHRSWRIRAFIWRNSCKHCNQHLLHSGWPWWRCTSSSRVDVALTEDEKGWTTINTNVLSLSLYFLLIDIACD